MIDVTINLTIDQDHEEDYDNIMDHIATTPGIVNVDVKTDTYHEYNIDSTPHWARDYEEVTQEELTRRMNLWFDKKYDGADYLLCEVKEENLFIAVDNAAGGEFYTEEFKTKEKAIAWINGEELEDDHYKEN